MSKGTFKTCSTLLRQVKSFPSAASKRVNIILGKLKPQAMITSKIKMDDIEEKGFKALIHNKDNHVKILVEVSP